MEVARGRLEDDGKVLLYDIEVTFEITVRPSGHKIWRGRVRVSGEPNLPLRVGRRLLGGDYHRSHSAT
jgi:hypothetical protein